MGSSGNGGAGGGGMAGAEGETAESISMAALGYEEDPASVDVGYDTEFGDPTGYMSSAQLDAVAQATETISRNAGSRSVQVAQRDAMVAAGVPGRVAGEIAVDAMQRARSAPTGSVEDRIGITPDRIAASALMFNTPFTPIAGLADFLADEAVKAGFDVQDVGEVDAGDTPASVGGDAAPPSPAVLAGSSQTTAGSTTMAQAPAVTPAPSATSAPAATQTGPTSAAAATATPLTAVGARRTQARRRGRSSTIATSTLGVPGQAGVARKTLLGA